MKRGPSLLVVFLTVFIDLVGFGIVLPLLPIYSEQHGASGLMIGVIIASFSAMQFLFAPTWGRWSDRVGRRPVLLISNFGSVISYSMFGVAGMLEGPSALWLLLASRVFAGICGANLSVANAYIADISPPDQRSKNMGLIGMAFGLGFILGPALGSFSVRLFGPAGPGFVAGAVCLFNFALTWTILGESRRSDGVPTVARPRLVRLAETLRHPTVGMLILIYFLAIFCFASFESTFSRLLHRRYENADLFIGYLFTYCGVLAAGVQGALIGRLVKAFGEARLVAVSLVMFAVGLVILPLVEPSQPWNQPFNLLLWGIWLTLGLGFVATGSAINRPPTFGLLSLNTPAAEQGETLGVAQSAGSLARILAPITANLLYEVDPALPYYVCAGIAAGAAWLAWVTLCRRRCDSAMA
jgi:MFS transporter, DHA1 family, tetracycline resistance protein